MDRDGQVDTETFPRVVPARLVLTGPGPTAVAVGRPETEREPQVELIRDGDVVRVVEVTCHCGRRLRLRCQYESANDGDPGA